MGQARTGLARPYLMMQALALLWLELALSNGSSCKSYLIFVCRDVKHKYRCVILEDYLTYRHRVMLVRFGTRVRFSHNSSAGANRLRRWYAFRKSNICLHTRST
jgi:hypothetical protein